MQYFGIAMNDYVLFALYLHEIYYRRSKVKYIRRKMVVALNVSYFGKLINVHGTITVLGDCDDDNSIRPTHSLDLHTIY